MSLALAALLAALSTSIANVGLPAIAQGFSAPFQDVQWVVLANLLSMTTLIVSVGRMGDMIGRRRLLLLGFAVFSAASVVCAGAPSLEVLIAARVAQGLGAAILMALATALAGEVAGQKKAGRAMGLLGSASAVGTALGPSCGGVLIALFGWRAVFVLTALLGCVALGMAYRALPGERPVRSKRVAFDAAGSMLLAGTLAAYALAMTVGRGHFGFMNAALLGAALCGVGAFVWVEANTASPLIRLSLFRTPMLSAGFMTSVIVTAVVMTTLVVGPFYLSGALGLNAAEVGLVMAVGPVVAALTGVPAGRSVDRFGAYTMSIVGLCGMIVGAGVFAVVPAQVGVAGYVAPLVMVTAGYALFQAANNTAVMASVGADQRGVLSGLLGLSRNLGLMTGAAMMGAIFAAATHAPDVASASAAALANGQHVTFMVAASLLCGALGVAVCGRFLSARAAFQHRKFSLVLHTIPLHSACICR